MGDTEQPITHSFRDAGSSEVGAGVGVGVGIGPGEGLEFQGVLKSGHSNNRIVDAFRYRDVQ